MCSAVWKRLASHAVIVDHTLAALRDVLGDLTELSALLETRVHEVRSDDDGTLLTMTAPFGHAQMAQLSLMGAKTGETAMGALAVPERFGEGAMPGPFPGNVTRNYARMFRDIQAGSRTASTFDDAVGVQKVIEAIRDAAKTGKRIRVDAPNRPLPLMGE